MRNEGRPEEHFYDSGTSERGNGGRFRVILIEEDSSAWRGRNSLGMSLQTKLLAKALFANVM